MSDNISYTSEEIASLLKVSKLTVYDLIKKGELRSYRVGKQMRVDSADLEAYKESTKSGHSRVLAVQQELPSKPSISVASSGLRTIVITGQDISLDILAKHLEKSELGIRPLRSFAGSMGSLISMYQGQSDIVSTHLLDGDSGHYNVPYISKLLMGFSYIVINLVSRPAGLYVQKGNPKQLASWQDLGQAGLIIANREKGSGARVLLDEMLRLHNIASSQLMGYSSEESSHMAVAGRIALGEADVGVGIEKAAQLVAGVEFIPLIQERYDLVMLKSPDSLEWIEVVKQILNSEGFKHELTSIQGYDLSRTGQVVFEN
ncbi:helix-turn-helix domain-containing protein [Paenibacillus psychroresistens]|uniref:Helix-turn-helix domain-containing protein n=1 Tax=Paenibacillus psychroresistens TaxID=1778678 RepID=A0A6B8RWS0_9BACL|nr:substrate-binding domain-containing protein [Paenibacillus psychroresistens]QGQ99528.1 helix-turn-helix domain-containing protein [Paenibacillus psychroresistens]